MAPAEGKAEILVPAVVGIPGIDSQHEALYGYLNDFIQLNLEKAPERQKVRESFDRLVHYTLSHFDDEEFFMRSIHYPDFERHAELHRNLREAVDEYYAFKNEFPESKYMKEADRIFERSQNALGEGEGVADEEETE